MHTRLFAWEWNLEGLMKFLDFLSTLPDVWIVTVGQAVEWVQDPTPVSKLSAFAPWDCKQYMQERPDLRCKSFNACKYKFGEWGERWMQTCSPCPPNYPWVGNPEGN